MNDQNGLPVWLVTGGCGFIGSNFIRLARRLQWARIVNLDKLTYAGNRINLESLSDDAGYHFVKGCIGDEALVRNILSSHRPAAVINFAAESHVDRSIHGPMNFVETNVSATCRLLGELRHYWSALPEPGRSSFRFLHISTDEVYGSLGEDDPSFTEESPYAPNSPYSASKAASDHFVRAYHHTYALPTLITNCSNNYGPYQFPEKLIPLVILGAIEGKPLPIYGDGKNIRDWLYVEDHCHAIRAVLERGRVGQSYNIGGRCEKSNLTLVQELCSLLDAIHPRGSNGGYESLICFVKDRPGHDRRYAIDDRKISLELGWKPQESFESALSKTVRWYLENKSWANAVRDGSYREWIAKNYDQDERGEP